MHRHDELPACLMEQNDHLNETWSPLEWEDIVLFNLMDQYCQIGGMLTPTGEP